MAQNLEMKIVLTMRKRNPELCHPVPLKYAHCSEYVPRKDIMEWTFSCASLLPKG